MRKHICVGLAIVAICFTGCGNSNELQVQNESLVEQVENLSATNESMSAEIDALTKEKDQLSSKLQTIQESLEESEAEKKIQDSDVTAVLISKESIPKDSSKWIFENTCPMSFDVTNNTDKDIQGVQGNLKIMDLFGKEIMTVGCDFLGDTIPAGQTVTKDMVYSVNEFIDSDMKLYRTDFKDLKTEYQIVKIVFTDGSEKE